MLKKILVANRGEIAVRIIRACKELGAETVAVYSEIDKDSLHVHLADEAICIGPTISSKSYLNISNIISAAKITKAEGIHPGYGFLSENTEFALMCEIHGIKLIGPKEEHIRKMGNKSEARRTMIEAGVPVVPGSEYATNKANEAMQIAKEIGFPVMIKAASGGGGRGMRLVYKKEDFISMFNMAKAESAAAFNDDSMYIEKYIEEPRHIEFQILADERGNVIHLGERDCSLQRRNQKVLEEAPCTVISNSMRKEMGEMAIKAAKAVNYTSAGTVEFLLDKHGNYYFIEMNTRIQVEHPITELITGIDLIKEQIKIASGKELGFTQEDVEINGHAIECRINAEDINNNFAPSPGTIKDYLVPGGNGIRIDTHIYSGYKIPSTYDSMIGKLIAWGRNRQEAICRLQRALDELIITGIKTNIDFHSEILNNKKFLENQINTSFINKEMMK
ncbi:acetyl-CoA carboxylase biotin carboxylase subunit [Paramaledivibacter caminithermalis]|jgi:acetyl-CoA carboxylase biotin carboxylase subunit|uniref:Biotin carboxylase n=1 Tax=Paramaledivibacter caminithermalis (strain DSM 15212 / CIP 107654 / DViRD3) TaxID=1121301 RepID=A0A1M6QPM1_PARC5|nr:acetyl-CoA carboxylase biotin carboxylase subunit [Paramaledivibacter caminithermalis]SHK22242.1 acetyl-CoA carboxylase, biotin carboxylase subunit [Paramaledivibacter caminithermalis DSM 15212]